MSTTNPPIEPDTKTERAADDLVRQFTAMIHKGALKDGDTLPPEREIVDTYGVSRTVVREAVLALASKGLIEARPRHRPVVRKPSYDTAVANVNDIVGRLLKEHNGIKNLFDTRIMVESSLAREAALHATRDDITRLKTALEANGAATQDNELFYETDIAFHAALYQVPRNPVLTSLHKAYTQWLAPQWSQMPRQPERNTLNFAAHDAIYQAILMRDPDAAEAAIRAHLTKAWEQVRATFDL